MNNIDKETNNKSLIVLQGLRKLSSHLSKKPSYYEDGEWTSKDDLFLLYNYQNFFKPSFINRKEEIMAYLKTKPKSNIEKYIKDAFCYLYNTCNKALSDEHCFEKNQDKFKLLYGYLRASSTMEGKIFDERKRLYDQFIKHIQEKAVKNEVKNQINSKSNNLNKGG